jgi:hypothetical protein
MGSASGKDTRKSLISPGAPRRIYSGQALTMRDASTFKLKHSSNDCRRSHIGTHPEKSTEPVLCLMLPPAPKEMSYSAARLSPMPKRRSI